MVYREIEFNTFSPYWFFLSPSPCSYTWEQLVKKTEAVMLRTPDVEYDDKVEVMKAIIDRAYRYKNGGNP